MSIELENIEKRLIKLENFYKKNYISQIVLILVFTLFILTLFANSSLNDKIGHFVKEKTLIEDKNGSIITSSKPVLLRDENGTKHYLRDSTSIYYSFFILLALILIVLSFANRRYSDIEHEE